MLKSIYSIQPIVVVADSDTKPEDVREAIEKEMGVSVQSIALIGRGDPPTGLNAQPRILWQSPVGIFGALRDAAMQYFQVLCTQNVTESFDIIKEAQKVAEKKAKAQAQVEAVNLAKTKLLEVKELQDKLAAMMDEAEKLQANADILHGAERDKEPDKEPKKKVK